MLCMINQIPVYLRFYCFYDMTNILNVFTIDFSVELNGFLNNAREKNFLQEVA